jgi:hypothetical protein
VFRTSGVSDVVSGLQIWCRVKLEYFTFTYLYIGDTLTRSI